MMVMLCLEDSLIQPETKQFLKINTYNHDIKDMEREVQTSFKSILNILWILEVNLKYNKEYGYEL